MTNVTALTKELVEQFEFAVGRRVTAAEYMDTTFIQYEPYDKSRLKKVCEDQQ